MMHTGYHYPGINVDLRSEPGWREPIYPHGALDTLVESELLPVREIFMMALMESLTNKVNWHEDVLDDVIVASWRKEALTQPEDQLYLQALDDKVTKKLPMPRSRILSETAFDYVSNLLRLVVKS